jgi:hypothetical protein
MPIQNANNPGPEPKLFQSMQTALNVCSLVTDKAWQTKIIMLVALQSYIVDLSLLRLPVYLDNDEGDNVVLRTILIELMGMSGIHIQTFSQNVLFQYFARSPRLVQDLTVANEALFYQVRYLAYNRGIPDNRLPSDDPISGNTVLLIREEFAGLVGFFGLVLRLEKNTCCYPDIAEIKAAIQPWRMLAESIAEKVKGEASFNSSDLPTSRVIPGTIRRGYYSLAETARWLDTNSGIDGFMAAVLECWKSYERIGYVRKTSRLVQSLIAYYLIPYLTNPENPEHCARGYRLDLMAEHLRSADAEHFADFNATELGKAFMRMGIGTPGRYVFPGGKGKASRIWRSCVKLSAVDKSLLEEMCHELQR